MGAPSLIASEPTDSRSESVQALGEKSPLGLGVHELERPPVCRARLSGPIEAAQEVGAGRVEVDVGVELAEAIDRLKAHLEALGFSQRHSTVQLDHRGTGQRSELAVEDGDL